MKRNLSLVLFATKIYLKVNNSNQSLKVEKCYSYYQYYNLYIYIRTE
jgi:hypothetical protein